MGGEGGCFWRVEKFGGREVNWGGVRTWLGRTGDLEGSGLGMGRESEKGDKRVEEGVKTWAGRVVVFWGLKKIWGKGGSTCKTLFRDVRHHGRRMRWPRTASRVIKTSRCGSLTHTAGRLEQKTAVKKLVVASCGV